MSGTPRESTVSPDSKWVTADLRAVARKRSGMSRDNGGTGGQVRSSALWGTGNRGGDSRANALCGKGGRGFAAFMLVLVATAVPLAGAGKGSQKPLSTPSYVDAYLTGMDKNRADFDMGTRVIKEVTLTTLPNNSPGDGRGHGTFVAGIAAGSAPAF